MKLQLQILQSQRHKISQPIHLCREWALTSIQQFLVNLSQRIQPRISVQGSRPRHPLHLRSLLLPTLSISLLPLPSVQNLPRSPISLLSPQCPFSPPIPLLIQSQLHQTPTHRSKCPPTPPSHQSPNLLTTILSLATLKPTNNAP